MKMVQKETFIDFENQDLMNPSETLGLLVLSPVRHPLDGRLQCQNLDVTITSVNTPLDASGNSHLFEILSFFHPPPIPPVVDTMRRIWLDGRLVLVPLPIYSALIALRARSSYPRKLWVQEVSRTAREWQEDSKDAEERSQDRMARWQFELEVVKQATEVIVSLHDEIEIGGSETVYSRTFELVQAMLKIERFLPSETTLEARELVKFLHGKKVSKEIVATAQNLWKAVTRICEMKYWNQISTLRLLSFARSVKLQNGYEVMPGDEFAVFLSQYANLFEKRLSKCATEKQLWMVRRFLMHTKNPLGQNYRTGLLNLLYLSRDSLCANGRDILIGLIPLANDINELDVTFDYTSSLFHLYVEVVEHFQLKEQRATNKILAVSQALQHSILGPEFSNTALEEMTCSRQSSQRTVRLKLQVMPKGKIVGISTNPEDLLGYMVAMEAVQRSELSRIYHTLFKSDFKRNPQPWRDLLVKTWEMDSGAFALFDNTGQEQNASLVGIGVVIYITEDMELGIAPRGIRNGDILFRFNGEGAAPFESIIREVAGSAGDKKRSHLKVIGRARSKEQTTFEQAFKAYITEKETQVDVTKLHSKWSSREIKTRLQEVDISLQELQALTCPLRCK